MEAIKFLKESNRICHAMYLDCKKCPLYPFYRHGCILYSEVKPERMDELKRAISILEQWAKEHPEKTRLQDFLEKYPKAHLCKNGCPPFRPAALGYCGESICSNCRILDVDCWNMPLEE